MSKKSNNPEKEKEKVETKVEEEVKEEQPSEETKEESKEKKEPEKKESKEDSLKKELEDQKNKYVRLFAEYDNYRKRTQNEKLSIYDDATKMAVTELLPIADSITMAIGSLNDDVPEEYRKGIELIFEQLKKSFDKLKVEEFGEIGDEFNPELHNAISKIDSEELGKNTISAVYQKGFKLKDKIIREAMVQVANCD